MGNQGASSTYEYQIIPGQKNLKPTKTKSDSNAGKQQQQSSINKASNERQKPIKQFKYKVTFIGLKDTFRYFAGQSDYLTKSQFNDSIYRIFNFPNIAFMHHSYLSEKIYYLLDDSGDGKIQEGEFVEGFRNVIMNQDYRNKRKNKI